MAQLSWRVQSLLAEARDRALTTEEMETVVNALYGAGNWNAVQFAVAREHVKPALFTTLMKGCGIDVREIKTL